MPLFEYRCRDCEKPFEAFVTTDRQPECPACHGRNLLKLLSSPGMVGVPSTSRAPQGCPLPNPAMCGGGGCGCH